MPDIIEQAQIPYLDQAKKVFNLFGEKLKTVGKQQIVPFLGAGVSISERTFSAAQSGAPSYPPRDRIDAIISDLKLDGPARAFMEMAVLLAANMQAMQGACEADEDTALLDRLQESPYPPSAGELAQLFSNLASYSSFQRVVEGLRKRVPGEMLSSTGEEQVRMLKLLSSVTGIANPPDSLTSITNYFEKVSDRDSLWDYLRLVISTKEKYTRTHRLIASAAKLHLEQTQVYDDYLVITTNYDCLMEKALDEVKAPYVVLVTKNSDHKVLVRFAPWMENAAELTEKYSNKSTPKNFTMQEAEKYVVVYKIHGCLNPELTEEDEGVIISDDDYVNYVSQMSTNDGAIPAYVNSAMQGKPFLFLGYSLNDWNVRSIFETLRKQRNPTRKIRDFSVMYSVRDFEKIFFDKNNVQIFRTDLKNYIDGLLPHLPEPERERFWGHAE